MVSTLHPCAQSTMAAEWQLPRVRSPFSAPIPLVWADLHDRPDAAEGRLRQVYAALGGMIGGSHKSERCRSNRSRTVDTLELRLRLYLRYWAKYPEGCRFPGIGASGDEKPVEFGNKQRSSCAGYRRDVGRAAVGVPLRLEHIHVPVAAAKVHALTLRIEEEIVGITTRTHGGNRAAVPHGEHA